MTTSRYDNQPCWLISLTGSYFTPNGTFSADPTHALVAERWWLQREQTRLSTPTIIARTSLVRPQFNVACKSLPSLQRLDSLFEVRDDGLYHRDNRLNASNGGHGSALASVAARAFVTVDKRKYRVCRIVWAMTHRSDPGQRYVEHIDGNTMNNAPANLRIKPRRFDHKGSTAR